MAIPVLTLTRHSWNCFEMWRTPSCHTVQIIFGPKQHSDTEVWDVPTVPKLALCCKGLDVCCATRGEVKREREGGGGGVFHYMSELRLIHMENHFLNTPLILIPHSHPRKGPLPSCLALVNVLTQPTESPDWKAQSLPPPAPTHCSTSSSRSMTWQRATVSVSGIPLHSSTEIIKTFQIQFLILQTSC